MFIFTLFRNSSVILYILSGNKLYVFAETFVCVNLLPDNLCEIVYTRIDEPKICNVPRLNRHFISEYLP